MKKIFLNLAVLAAFSLFISGCASVSESKGQGESPEGASESSGLSNSRGVATDLQDVLVRTSWVPTFMKAQGASRYPQGKNGEERFVHLNIGEGLRVSGMSGDNFFNGSMSVSPLGDASLSKMVSTRRLGPYGEYENKFLNALAFTDKIELSQDRMQLSFFGGGELLLRFKRIEYISK